MPDLKQSLLDHDLGHLRILAEHWGVYLEPSDSRKALTDLVDRLLDAKIVAEIVEALPEDANLALNIFQTKNWRMPWPQFTRRFGEVREMGPGRRDRERPDRVPVSTAEVLWYRAFVARAFFDTARGTEEFAYIPEDLAALIPKTIKAKNKPGEDAFIKKLGRAATATERAFPIKATDRVLDHACTLIAGLRMGIDSATLDAQVEPYPRDFIHALIDLSGLLNPNGLPNPEAARGFLEAPRGEALALLAQTWLNSSTYNDLHHIPGLQPEGEWSNDPLGTRQFIQGLLSALPKGTWWCLSAFTADIQQQYPDFQRPAGDYDTWFLRQTSTGKFLRGYQHWNDVDGALIRHLITGPLHWLGMVDLASTEEGAAVTAFRYSLGAAKLIAGEPPSGLPEENARVHIRSDGRVNVPVLVPRAVRYQLARFCLWEGETRHEYRYRLTPGSLAKSRESGLRISHLLALLGRHADTIPPNILTALNHWDERGTEVRLQDVTILRLGSPQLLQTLRNSRAARFLGDPLGPTTIIVKPGTGEKVLAILTEMGYLGEIIGED